MQSHNTKHLHVQYMNTMYCKHLHVQYMQSHNTMYCKHLHVHCTVNAITQYYLCKCNHTVLCTVSSAPSIAVDVMYIVYF